MSIAVNSFAQNKSDSTKVKAVIKIYPLNLFTREACITYEQYIKHNMSFEIGGGYKYVLWNGEYEYAAWTYPDPTFDAHKCSGFVINSGMTFFFSGNKKNKIFFLKALLIYTYSYRNESDFFQTNKTIGCQLICGYRKLNSKKINFNIYYGLGFKKALYHEEDIYPATYPFLQAHTEIYNYARILPALSLGITADYKIF